MYLWWHNLPFHKLAIDIGFSKHAIWFKLCLWHRYLQIGYDFP